MSVPSRNVRTPNGEHANWSATVARIDINVQPDWQPTGYKHFPYAARQFGQWWVLRANHEFPAHDMWTVFIDGTAAADMTGDKDSEVPLIASIGALPIAPGDESTLDDETAEVIVRAVARYVEYGSESDDPCFHCSAQDWDGMARHDSPS